jgi:hypothetical protein
VIRKARRKNAVAIRMLRYFLTGFIFASCDGGGW